MTSQIWCEKLAKIKNNNHSYVLEPFTFKLRIGRQKFVFPDPRLLTLTLLHDLHVLHLSFPALNKYFLNDLEARNSVKY